MGGEVTMKDLEEFEKKRKENRQKERDEIYLSKILYLAFCEQHKKTFASFYEKLSFQAPEVANKLIPVPEWDSLSDDLKQCWIAVGRTAIQYFEAPK